MSFREAHNTRKIKKLSKKNKKSPINCKKASRKLKKKTTEIVI